MATAALAALTPAEAAILRSWLGGNEVHSIAHARRIPVQQVMATIRDLCDFNRPLGRRVLFANRRIPTQPHQVTPVAAPRPAHPRPTTTPKPKPKPTPRPSADAADVPSHLAGIAHTEQYRIVLAYAHGHRLTAIAHDLDLPLIYVTGVVGAICGLDRATARRQAIRWLTTRPKEHTHA